MAASIGKVFESELKEVFKLLKKSHLVGVQRFSDSGAAGTIIAEQPSDYLLGLPPGSISPLDNQRLIYLEVKASEEKGKLGKAMVKPAQRNAIAVYRHLLNIPYLIMFWDAQTGLIQLWDGIAIQDERISSEHVLAEWPACGVINKLLHAKVAGHIVDHFKIPPAAVTLAKVR